MGKKGPIIAKFSVFKNFFLVDLRRQSTKSSSKQIKRAYAYVYTKRHRDFLNRDQKNLKKSGIFPGFLEFYFVKISACLSRFSCHMFNTLCL